MLPFTAEVLYALLVQYNGAIWPAQVAAYGLAVVVVVLLFRPVAGGGRLIGAILAAAWAWNGIGFHLMHFAAINFIAPVFAVFFVVEALLLGWSLALRGSVAFRFRADAAGWAGLGLAIFALAGYPLLGWLAGHGWPQAALAGVAPGPTTIFTIGILLLAEGRTPLHLVAIPLLWSLAGGAAAWILGIPEDLALPLAGIGGLCLILLKNRRHLRQGRARAAKAV